MSRTGLGVSRPRVEYLDDPIGITVDRPRLSWIVTSAQRDQRQRAYRIIVASEPAMLDDDNGDLWDTGRVESDETAQIAYEGTPLLVRQRAWWKVRSWNQDDAPSAWSEIGHWEAGLLKPAQWIGRWLSLPGLVPDDANPETAELDALVPAPLFRRVFTVTGEVASARLYATARGVYEPSLNGTAVGDQVLAPGWTDYTKRQQFQTYDVTSDLVNGENVLGGWVAPGWFCGYVGWQRQSRFYGTTPQLLMQLHVDYSDGRSEVIATDDAWRATTGPIRYADLLMGEYYDARRELRGWNTAGYDDRDWDSVAVSARNAVPFVSDPAQPIRTLETIAPIAVTEPSSGTFIFDLGQNIAGRVSLRATGPAGTAITLRFGEILDDAGSLYTTNLRGARATDTFVLAGDGEEVFEPRFTFHGFRYVEVTGFPGTPGLDALTGRFVGSDTRPAGDFACSDDLVDQLQRNIVWGQRGNFLSVPTDCPQRDERLGWLGDAQVFAATAIGNMDVSAFFTKWMRDVSDAQGWNGAFSNVAPRLVDLDDAAPAWGDCGVILPWTIWRAYGDTRIIDEHWPAMAAWVRWIRDANPDLLWRHNRMHDYGDWLSIGADTPKELIGTAYFGWDAKLMAEMAEATGRVEDATTYRRLFDDIAVVFRDAYVAEDGTIEGDTQTVYCLALHFGLLPEDQQPVAAKHLVERIADKGGHLSTGFVGVSYLCHVLTEHGYPDIAYRLLLNKTFPSWKYSILQGATTIWERWDGWTGDKGFQDPGMNSFNHYSLGSVGDWLKRSVAGIDQVPGTVGYERLRIRPRIGDELSFAEGRYDSIRGPVRSRWERRGEGLVLDVDVPANATAEVWIPAGRSDRITEGDCEIALRERRDDAAIVEVGSGSWTFKVTNA